MSIISKFFCRIGLHSWKLSGGLGFDHGRFMVVTYDKDCRRCGKHEEGVMLL